MTAAELIARADEIDNRLGPIPGHVADAIAVQLREAAKIILALEQVANSAPGAALLVHIEPRADGCDHDFRGFRAFEDGSGGESVCTKCGMGAMTHSLWMGE